MQAVYAQYANSYRRLIHVGGCHCLLRPAGLALAVLLIMLAALPAGAQPDGADNAENNAADTAASAGRTRPATEQQWMQAYMTGDRPAGAMWLAEGEQAFIGIYHSAVEPYQMGVLLLGNRPQELLPGSPLQQLAGYLPLHGWSSLIAVLPPAPAPAPLPGRTLLAGGVVPPGIAAADGQSSADSQNSTDNQNSANSETNTENQSSADNDALTPATIATQRIASAGRWLLDQGAGSLTLVATASTLQWALRAAVADAQNTSGLVLWQIDAAALDAKALAELRASRVSILDILPAQPDAQTLLARKRLFQRAGFSSDYRSIVLPLQRSASMAKDAIAELANKRIRHWLGSEFEKN